MNEARGNHAKPVVCILDASTAMTGALMAIRREAALLSDRARFVLFTPADNSLPDGAFPEFETVVRIPIRPLRKTASSLLGYGPALVRSGHRIARELKKHQCSRLQVNDFYLAQSWMARRFGYRGRIVTWVRVDPRNFGLAGKIWLSLARNASNAIVAVSEFVDRRLKPRATALVYDPAPHAPRRQRLGKTLLFVGNYIEGKGQDLAIKAFHNIAETYPDVVLQCHGSTMGLDKNKRYLQSLERLARDGAGRDRIRLNGFASDLASAYDDAFLAINCSNSESFSLTCLEASAQGLPIIATRSGGPQEIIKDGETGFLIDLDDADALARRLRLLLDDRERAGRMGGAGREWVLNKFGEKRFRERLTALLEI